MSHTVCHDIGNWVESNIQQQVEQCIDQDCIWWCVCCNKWFCFLVWVVLVVVTWVITTLCETVADIVELVVNIVLGLVDIVAGIFTLDGSRILAGLGEIVGGIVAFVVDSIPIATFGTLVGAFQTSRNAWELREFARDLLEMKYKDADPEGFKKMEDAVGLNSGGFGLRLDARALRTFIRSDFRSDPDGRPDLVDWVGGGLDLKSLAGFNPPAWWARAWPELVGDKGGVSQADLDSYVAKEGVGADVKQFSLFSMRTGDLRSRLDCADQHASEVGLVFRWTIEDTMLQLQEQVLIDFPLFLGILTTDPFTRHNRRFSATDSVAASSELATPMVIGCFGFTENLMGLSAHLADCTCLEARTDGATNFDGDGMTGTIVRYRKPDLVFKYSAIHELGHTFGLCHVDGLLRIMFTMDKDEKKSVFSLSSFWQYWTHGLEAGFILDEGKEVWQYIVDNFDPATLENRPF